MRRLSTSAMWKALVDVVRDAHAGQSTTNPGPVQRLLGRAVVALAPGWELPGVGWRDKRGSVALMTAMLGLVLIGFAALAVDVGIWEGNAGAMQGAADQAALAAGLAMSAGAVAAQKEAKGVAAANGFVDGTGGVGVAVNIPPTTVGYASKANAIEVVITQPQALFLSGVFLQSPPTASAKAVAVAAPASTCLLLLAPTGGIAASGTGSIDAGGCNVYVNGGPSCDVVLSGGINVTGYDVFLGELSQSGCVAAPSQVIATNKLQLGTAPARDPYGSRIIPTPSTPCKTIDTSPQVITLNPGTYCGLTLLDSKSVTLSSGVYIFDGGGIAASGNNIQITGTNVTLVFTSSGSSYGNISLSGSVTVNLTPMTHGVTAGIAIWLDKAGGKPIASSGTNNFTITGAIYAPNSQVAWSGGGGSPCTQLIAFRMALSGSATFQHNCSGFGVADVGSAAGYKLAE